MVPVAVALACSYAARAAPAAPSSHLLLPPLAPARLTALHILLPVFFNRVCLRVRSTCTFELDGQPASFDLYFKHCYPTNGGAMLDLTVTFQVCGGGWGGVC